MQNNNKDRLGLTNIDVTFSCLHLKLTMLVSGLSGSLNIFSLSFSLKTFTKISFKFLYLRII